MTTLDKDGLWSDDSGMMSTYTRRRINPLKMTPEDVDIRDIARALTMQCRYAGHVGRFYSVAEHSVFVSNALRGTGLELAGLLHDAAEAYLGDLIRPLKHGPMGEAYLEAEEHVERCIAQAFGLPHPMPPEVLEADRKVLTEYELPDRRWAEDGIDPNPRLLSIEKDFLRLFDRLSVPMVLGLAGYAQSGKDTFARFLVEDHGFVRVAFADTLRDMLYALNPAVRGLSGEWLDLQELIDGSEWFSGIGWERAKLETPDVRGMLQRLGTEAGREILGQNIWVDTAMKKLTPGRRYVFTDVRFPNEFDAIKAAGGKVIRLQRDGRTAVNAHPSETALDDHVFDEVLGMRDDPEGHEAALRQLAANLVERIVASRVGD